MTVKQFAEQHDLWAQVCAATRQLLADADAEWLLARIATVPIRSSRAVRSLGSYVSRLGEPVCIRLQLAQEVAVLRETFLHELAHLCDHLCHQAGQRYRRAHGPFWRRWASQLGATPERCGKSENLELLYRQRLKLVAVCQRCGHEIYRTRRLNRGRKYSHRTCGGLLKPV